MVNAGSQLIYSPVPAQISLERECAETVCLDWSITSSVLILLYSYRHGCLGTRRYRVLTRYRAFGAHNSDSEVVQRQTATFTKDSKYAPSRLQFVLHVTFPAGSPTFTIYFTKWTVHRYSLHKVKCDQEIDSSRPQAAISFGGFSPLTVLNTKLHLASSGCD